MNRSDKTSTCIAGGVPIATLLFSATMLGFASLAVAQNPGLKITYGALGVEQVSYRGQVLEDIKRWPDDSFHIWHMQGFRGNRPEASGQYGWGENNNGRSWDAEAKAWTYQFGWGSVRTAYVQHGDALNVTVTLTNRADSGVTMDGATVYALNLHDVGSATDIGDGRTGPGVSVKTWAASEVAVVAPDAAKPVYSGFEAGKDGAVSVVVSGTRPDSLVGAALSGLGRPVGPGQSDTVTISIRFASKSVPAKTLAADAYDSWRTRWPQKLEWADRRIIGTIYLATSAQGERSARAGFANNPRRYFGEDNKTTFDIRNDAGLGRFQVRMLLQATTAVDNLRRLHAQGMVTWDLEGEEYPQNTSYVCAPDTIGKTAPEMESVLGSWSAYAGMKLDDAYFKIIRDAGFRVGVCIRPQHFEIGNDGRARQVTLPDSQVAGELIRKMRFAHDRWGATLFYLDSTVQADGKTLDSSIIEEAAAAMPDSLLIPEETTLRMDRATAPFMTFMFHGDTGTEAATRAAYPKAFGVNLINDVESWKLTQHRAELVDSVRHGDVLMVHAEYWQANNVTAMEIYRAAGREP